MSKDAVLDTRALKKQTSYLELRSSTPATVPGASVPLNAMDQFKELCFKNGFKDFRREENTDDTTIMYVLVFRM
jgi:hypothetical protein